MYGDSTASTPNLDALAAESMIYDNAFATVGVCAPARSSIITGMYPTVIGTMHMRTAKDITAWGKRTYSEQSTIQDAQGKPIRQYASVVPAPVKCFTEYLRANGYYCTNNQKTDYQFAAPITAWDQNGLKAHWRNRIAGQPFFSVFNFNSTHESKLWKNKNLPLTVEPSEVIVPPYLQDSKIMRNDIARHYSNIELLDKQVGQLVTQLKEDDLYEETLIFFYSDHGGPFPRQKREIYDSGLKVPFFIKYPNASERGRETALISFVDLAPTVLSLAGIAPPDYMNGRAFLGKYTASKRNHVFASGDRFDQHTDRVRSIRTNEYLYIRNYMPGLTGYKDLGYRKHIAGMNEMLVLKEQGKLSEERLRWFQPKPEEELYNVAEDPHNLRNLAADPTMRDVLKKMSNLLAEHQLSHPDLGILPESELIRQFWPNEQQPKAATPSIAAKGDRLIVAVDTEGASIAYRWADQAIEKLDPTAEWKLYSEPISIVPGKFLIVLAERIGFQTSDLVSWKP